MAPERKSKPPDLVVVSPLTDWTCAACAGSGDLLTMEDSGPLCMRCADLDHLVFLPAGDAALTRRAKKASGLAAVVVRFSRARRRYERQGILVEETALEQAERDCLADEESRERRRLRERSRRAAQDVELQAEAAREIQRLFPGCPEERAEAIARHTCERGSGRVGRTAAGRSLDPEALALAVAAAVRHADTDYDVAVDVRSGPSGGSRARPPAGRTHPGELGGHAMRLRLAADDSRGCSRPRLLALPGSCRRHRRRSGARNRCCDRGAAEA